MTVNTTIARSEQNGNGVSVIFNLPFYFLANTDLLVYVGGVLQVLTTDYSVTGAGEASGGAITFLAAPAVGVGNVVIIRDPDQLQATRYPPNDPFPAASHERALDKLTMLVQRIYDFLSRSIRQPDSDGTFNMELPAAAARANTFLAFDSSGNVIASPGSSGGTAISAAMIPVVQAASVAAGRTALGALSSAAGAVGSTNLATGAVTAVHLAASAQAMLSMLNGTLSVTASAGAITAAIKTRAGANPSAADPVYVNVANVTGGYTTFTIAAANSATLPSGATAGSASGTAARIYVTGSNDGGAFKLGFWNPLGGTAASPTLIGAADDVPRTSVALSAGSTSAQTLYTTAAITPTAAPLRALGYFEATQTAGAWATPTKVQLMMPGVKRTGDTFQPIRFDTGAVATGTGTIPFDDSPPQIGEGDQYIAQAITPSSATNLLAIKAQVLFGNTAAASNDMIVSLFQDAIASALRTVVQVLASGSAIGPMGPLQLEHKMLAGTVSSTTFRIRAGGSVASTSTFNGGASARLFGGVINSYIEITEIVT